MEIFIVNSVCTGYCGNIGRISFAAFRLGKIASAIYPSNNYLLLGGKAMKLTVIGSGYVGLTAGICFAESGNNVICVDVDEEKINSLNRGILPIYELGLQELLVKNLDNSNLFFTIDLADAVQNSQIIFIAVGTPPGPDGYPDLTQVDTAAYDIIRYIPDYRIIVIKSTVPIGTNSRLSNELARLTEIPFDLVSNPEFLKEGCAIEDFFRPDRIIIGTTSPNAAAVLQELYDPFVRNGKPIIVMDPTSAEMTKYAANAMLGTKISFINEIANLCDLLGADINNVRRGICSDIRIGYHFLYPGLGFGGSCFPKDVQALIRIGETHGYPGWLLRAVKQVNDHQKFTLQRKIISLFGEDLTGLHFALWGAAFKPGTDDIRESPAIGLISDILSRSGHLHVHDPQALENLKKIFGNQIQYYQEMYQMLENVDALCILTEWAVYRNPDIEKMLQLMRRPIIFDGRNLYECAKMTGKGFTYFGIGRGHPIASLPQILDEELIVEP
jgi:UDPglucose 6-dehydrogenase